VRLKLEDAADNTKTVEVEATTTAANAWETLSFDFSKPAAGTAALNLDNTYNKASIFPHFGSKPSADVPMYFDDLKLSDESSGGGTGSTDFSSLSFDESPAPTLTGFGGLDREGASTIAADPTDASNKVLKTVKTNADEVWAGVTVSTGTSLSIGKVGFTADKQVMTMRVYSPSAGLPVRLKLEDAADNTKTVEVEATTTAANAWETLSFDFSKPVSGTAALNLDSTYNKASIFPHFGSKPSADVPMYFDDLKFN
jgi:hypothetical protein